MYPAYPPLGPRRNGDAKYVKFLSENLVAAGCEVAVITSRTEHYTSIRQILHGLIIYPVIENWGTGGLFKGELKVLKNTLAEIKPDLINIVYPDPYLASGYLLPYAVPFVCGRIPVITTLFHFFPKRGNVLYKFLAVLLYFGSARVHFHNEYFMKVFTSILPFMRNRALLIPVGNMVDVSKKDVLPANMNLKRKLGLDTACRYAAFFGYWYRSKGVDLLLRSFALIADKRPDARLLLVGGPEKNRVNDYEKYILSLIEQMGLNNKVVVTGQCPDAAAVEYMLCSDFCVFPFRSNTAGRTKHYASN
jgi:glycosyltransferase involved in cell wall biosynthesis